MDDSKHWKRGINNNLKEMAHNHADSKVEYPMSHQNEIHGNKIDESSPEYQKAKKKIHEIESLLLHYESKLYKSLFDLDMGLPGKTDAEYYMSRINELKEEKSELETQLPARKYTTAEADKIKLALLREEGRMYSMKSDQEILGVSYANQLSFYDYKINELKQELKKARKFQG